MGVEHAGHQSQARDPLQGLPLQRLHVHGDLGGQRLEGERRLVEGRRQRPWPQRVDASVKTSLALSWSGTVRRNGAGYSLIKDLVFVDDYAQFLILDGDKTTPNATGYLVDCQVFKADNDQGRNSTLYDDIEIMPTIGDHLPKRVRVKDDGSAMEMTTITGDAATWA